MDPQWGPSYAYLLRTIAYVKSLPQGLDSYPECASKASVWKNILRLTDARGLAGRVPPELLVFSSPGMLDGAWISAVQSFAGHLALRDCLFQTDDAICEHFRRLDRELLSGRLYRALIALASPRMVVHAADRRFASMFKGITLEAQDEGPRRVLLTLKYPPELLPPLVGRLYLIAFEVAASLAGGRNVVGKVLEHGSTAEHQELCWEE
jgi:hypothetical protein